MTNGKNKQVPYGAYYKREWPGHDPELTETQPGSPMGELMRKFWQPICHSEELTDVPKALRLLNEDLVAFRDRSGRVGALQRHCSHRGTSLEYGIIQPRGIRCCYHGWVYDIDGTILEMPAEPKDSKIYDTVVHGAYPAFERHGLVFVYMGDPAEKPEFPEFDGYHLPEGTEYHAFSHIYPCNWLQVYENIMDHCHTATLHTNMTVESVDAQIAEGVNLDGFNDMPIMDWEIDAKRQRLRVHRQPAQSRQPDHLGPHHRDGVPQHAADWGPVPVGAGGTPFDHVPNALARARG